MAISATAGSKLYIGGIRLAATTDIEDFEALTWVEVKEITNLGSIGDTSQTITVDTVGEGRTRKLKGTRDSGDASITCAWDPLDPGQVAVRAAEKTSFDYAFKLEANDAADANDTKSVFYWHAKVMSASREQGGPNDVVTMAMTLGNTTAILEDASTVVP
jgi:hypothetical protein